MWSARLHREVKSGRRVRERPAGSAPGSLETKSIGGSSSDIIWRQLPSDVNQAPGQLNVFVANDGINLASENN